MTKKARALISKLSIISTTPYSPLCFCFTWASSALKGFLSLVVFPPHAQCLQWKTVNFFLNSL